MTSKVDFFWDPVCPFCWVTSRWVRQVQTVRDIDVDWRFISLRFLNEPLGYDDRPEFYPAIHARGTDYLRVAAAVRAQYGPEAMGPLYEAIGTLLWETPVPEGKGAEFIVEHQLAEHDVAALLTDLGFDPSLADAMTDPGFDEELRNETKLALDRVGGDVGTPIITFGAPDGPSFFGPVVADNPTSADEAARYWDAIETLAGWPSFSELKRTARSFPVAAITTPLTGTTTNMR